jgi:hypothetical protein
VLFGFDGFFSEFFMVLEQLSHFKILLINPDQFMS